MNGPPNELTCAYIDIHLDWSPKLRFIKHIKHPIAKPKDIAVMVNSGCMVFGVFMVVHDWTYHHGEILNYLNVL